MYTLGYSLYTLCTSVYYSQLKTLVKSQFKEDFPSVFKHLAAGSGAPTEDDMRSLLFGDYMKPDAVSNTTPHTAHVYM